MNCYSKYNSKNPQCAKCKLKKYCMDSGDLPLLATEASGIPIEKIETMKTFHPEANQKLKYTQADMLEVIGFLFALDNSTLDILSEKLQDPTISMAKIAKKRNISRQAVHKFLKQRLEKIPELEAIFLKRKNLLKNNQKTTNFMEAVCQIKQQSLEHGLNKQKQNLNYYNSLICLNRNLDLSRMSIGKDIKFLSKD